MFVGPFLLLLLSDIYLKRFTMMLEKGWSGERKAKVGDEGFSEFNQTPVL